VQSAKADFVPSLPRISIRGTVAAAMPRDPRRCGPHTPRRRTSRSSSRRFQPADGGCATLRGRISRGRTRHGGMSRCSPKGGLRAVVASDFNPGDGGGGDAPRPAPMRTPQSAKADFPIFQPPVSTGGRGLRDAAGSDLARKDASRKGCRRAVREGGLCAVVASGFNPGDGGGGDAPRPAPMQTPQSAKADFPIFQPPVSTGGRACARAAVSDRCFNPDHHLAKMGIRQAPSAAPQRARFAASVTARRRRGHTAFA
jgi:hypothetical protein